MKTTELQNIKQRYNIVGNCEALNNALDVALKVAPIDLSVLIIGESGVGKTSCLASFTTTRRDAAKSISLLTAAPSLRVLSILSSSDTSRVRLRVPSTTRRVTSV